VVFSGRGRVNHRWITPTSGQNPAVDANPHHSQNHPAVGLVPSIHDPDCPPSSSRGTAASPVPLLSCDMRFFLLSTIVSQKAVRHRTQADDTRKSSWRYFSAFASLFVPRRGAVGLRPTAGSAHRLCPNKLFRLNGLTILFLDTC
jgi:hypothetical protein